jgi:hypothetical protein
MAVVERAQNEVWQNPTQGTVFVLKMDHRGDLVKYEQVDAGRKFYITTEERRLNMEKAANESQDVFRNGTLQPIRLIGDDEESRELAANPNVMAASDMSELLKGHYKTFESKLAQIQNISTLERLLSVAYEDDVSVKRVELVKLRIAEVGSLAGRVAPVPVADPSRGLGGRADFGRPVSPR